MTPKIITYVVIQVCDRILQALFLFAKAIAKDSNFACIENSGLAYLRNLIVTHQHIP